VNSFSAEIFNGLAEEKNNFDKTFYKQRDRLLLAYELQMIMWRMIEFNFVSFFPFIFYQVLSTTYNGFINCSCNHLTSFGGAFLIKPNPIDFDKVSVEFKNLEETENVAVFVTISVVLLCYIVVLLIVRKADKKDARNVSIDEDNLFQ